MGGEPNGPRLVVNPGEPNESTIAIDGRLFIGRECAGIDAAHRLLIDDPMVSRNHLEIRVDGGGGATVIDVSTNGTRHNGRRLQRAVAVELAPGDRLRVGATELEFRSLGADAGAESDSRRTTAFNAPAPVVVVVGDIIGYSTLSQHAASEVVASALDDLYGSLRPVLDRFGGTFVTYVGDAFFAFWELDVDPDAPTRAVDFALAALDTVDAVAPSLSLKGVDGQPLRMGWAVVQGLATVSSITNTPMTLLGDTVNLAFRLAGVSGRNGHAPVIVTANMAMLLAGAYRLGKATRVEVKGRSGTEAVLDVLGPA